MRRMIRFGALIPVVAFMAACSAAGTTGTGQITSSDPYETVSGDATSMLVPPDCKNVIDVEVWKLAPSMTVTEVRLQARYLYSKPGGRCTTGPRWGASRPGITVHPRDPFHAWIPRNPVHERTVVTATAPNGVKGTLVF